MSGVSFTCVASSTLLRKLTHPALSARQPQSLSSQSFVTKMSLFSSLRSPVHSSLSAAFWPQRGRPCCSFTHASPARIARFSTSGPPRDSFSQTNKIVVRCFGGSSVKFHRCDHARPFVMQANSSSGMESSGEPSVKVAVGQMTAVSDKDANFETCKRLAEVRLSMNFKCF